jgi:hypothetical protein
MNDASCDDECESCGEAVGWLKQALHWGIEESRTRSVRRAG